MFDELMGGRGGRATNADLMADLIGPESGVA
jgi:hypothetical protein